MSETDPVAEAVWQLTATQTAFIKAVRWRTWAIAGWAVATVLLIVILFGAEYVRFKATVAEERNQELLKVIDRFNRLAHDTNRPERLLPTYGPDKAPAPATVTTVPLPPTK